MATSADNGAPTPETDSESYRTPEYTQLENQYKGLQRKLNRANEAVKRNIGSEELVAEVSAISQKVDALMEINADDDEREAIIRSVQEQVKARQTEVGAETKVLQQIQDLEIEHDADFQSDPVAMAYWEAGAREKALEQFQSTLSTNDSPPIDEPNEGQTPQTTRIDTGRSTVSTDTPTRRNALMSAIDEAEKRRDIREMSRLAIQLNQLQD